MAPGPTLLVDTSFLGDVLCAEPLARAAARRWPGQPVDFLVSPGGARILEGHPSLRDVLVFDKRGSGRGLLGLLRTVRELRARGYARALCSHRSWRSAVLLRASGIPVRVGFHNASLAWLYTRKIRYRKDLHEISRNLELLGGGPWERPRMFPSPSDWKRAEELAPVGRFVALAPGSLWATKRWPEDSYAQVAGELLARGISVVLLGGAEDRELCARIATSAVSRRSASTAELRDLAGRTTLRQSYAVLRQAAALVSNDSAPMHLGVAAGIPVLAIYCSTLPAFGFAPRGPSDRIFEVGELSCRPCGVHGRRACPKDHFECGWGVTPETILRALDHRLAATSS